VVEASREEKKVRKYPPEVGTRLSIDELKKWCLTKAYGNIECDDTLLLFCRNDGDFRVCTWRLEEGEKSFVKTGESTLSLIRLRTLIGTLERLEKHLSDVASRERGKLARESG